MNNAESIKLNHAELHFIKEMYNDKYRKFSIHSKMGTYGNKEFNLLIEYYKKQRNNATKRNTNNNRKRRALLATYKRRF